MCSSFQTARAMVSMCIVATLLSTCREKMSSLRMIDCIYFVCQLDQPRPHISPICYLLQSSHNCHRGSAIAQAKCRWTHRRDDICNKLPADCIGIVACIELLAGIKARMG